MKDRVVKCQKVGCGGDLGGEEIPISMAGKPFAAALACKECGRVHFSHGRPIFNQAGQELFQEDGRVVGRDREVVEST